MNVIEQKKSRVHITYDVDVGDAIEKKELPFVVGIIGDFAQGSAYGKLPLKDKMFIEINQRNFSQVMQYIKPEVEIEMDNLIANDGSSIKCKLIFQSMDDFKPENLVEQVPELKNLIELRKEFQELLLLLERKDELNDIFKHSLQDEILLNRYLDVFSEQEAVV